MKILLTGCAGFIGSSLADKLLSQGHSVIGVDNFCDFYPEEIKQNNIKQALANPNFHIIKADIRDRESILAMCSQNKPEVIVHLAGMAGVLDSLKRPEYYMSVNLDGTGNMLDGAVLGGTKKFIFASSSSVYGNNKKIPFSEEDDTECIISPYAATKKAGEIICHTYWHIHKMPIACLRFFTVFGPRQRSDLAISKFMKLIHEEKPIQMYGDGSTSRDYTYIDDITDGIIASIDKCNDYGVYNLGGSSPVTLKDLINMISEVVGKPAKVEIMPMQVGDVDITYADLTRSRNELGYIPKTSLRDGIVKQYKSMFA